MVMNSTPKATTKNSPVVRVGKNKDNGNASMYKANGTSVAAEKKAVGADVKDPNTLSGQQVNRKTLAMDVSIGNIGPDYAPEKPSLTMRGYGAAEHGIKTSNKMG